jgi:pyrroloquinoline quinone biosynthesis protein D
VSVPEVPLDTEVCGYAQRPRLVRYARLQWDESREAHVLLTPEGVLVLNPAGAAILALCDGERSIGDIATELRQRYNRVVEDEVRSFLGRLAARHLLKLNHDG